MYNYLYYLVAINELVEAEQFAFDKLIVNRVELRASVYGKTEVSIHEILISGKISQTGTT